MRKENRVRVHIIGVDKFSHTFRRLEASLRRINDLLRKIDTRIAKVEGATGIKARPVGDVGESLKELRSALRQYELLITQHLNARNFRTAELYFRRFRDLGKELVEEGVMDYMTYINRMIQVVNKFTAVRKLIEREQMLVKQRAMRGALRARLGELESAKAQASSMLTEAFSNVYSLSFREFLQVRKYVENYKKVLREMHAKGYIDTARFNREMFIITNRFRTLRNVMLKNIDVFGSWWKRFGEVALGFTLVYRSVLLVENAVREFISLLHEGIESFNEMGIVAYRMVMMYQFFGKSAVSYQQVLRASFNLTKLLRFAMINTTASLRDVVAGLDELAQHGVFLTDPSKLRAYVTFFSFIDMIATTTRSSFLQVRQEIQSLFEGTKRAGNTLIRFIDRMAKQGIVSKDIVKQIQNAGNATQQLDLIVSKVAPKVERMFAGVFAVSSEKAMQRLRNILVLISELAFRIANLRVTGDSTRNMFAQFYNELARGFIRLDLVERFTMLLSAMRRLREEINEARRLGKEGLVGRLVEQYRALQVEAERLYPEIYTQRGKELAVYISYLYSTVYKATVGLTKAFVVVIEYAIRLGVAFKRLYDSMQPVSSIILKLYLLSLAFKGVWRAGKLMLSLLITLAVPLRRVVMLLATIGSVLFTTTIGRFAVALVGLTVALRAVVALIQVWIEKMDVLKDKVKDVFVYISAEMFRLVRKLATAVPMLMPMISLPLKLWQAELEKEFARMKEKHKEGAKEFLHEYWSGVKEKVVGFVENLKELMRSTGEIVSGFLKVDLEGMDEVLKKLMPTEEGFKLDLTSLKEAKEQLRDIATEFSSVLSAISEVQQAYESLYQSLVTYDIADRIGVSLDKVKEKVLEFMSLYREKLLEQYVEALGAGDYFTAIKTRVSLLNARIQEKLFRFNAQPVVKNIKEALANVRQELSNAPQGLDNLFSLEVDYERLMRLRSKVRLLIEEARKAEFGIFDKDTLRELENLYNQITLRIGKTIRGMAREGLKETVDNIRLEITAISQALGDVFRMDEAYNKLIRIRDVLHNLVAGMKAGKFGIVDRETIVSTERLLRSVEEKLIDIQRRAGGFSEAMRQFLMQFRSNLYVEMETTRIYMQTITSTYDIFVRNLGDAFFAFATRQGMTLRQFIGNIAQDIMRMLSQALAKLIVLKTVSATLGTAGFGGTILRLFGIQARALGGIFEGGFIPVKKFSAGGIVDRPTIGIVGEGRYNEAVVPLPDGRSIPVILRQPQIPQVTPRTEVNIVNVIDPALLSDYLVSVSGQEAIINVIANNRGKIKHILGD